MCGEKRFNKYANDNFRHLVDPVIVKTDQEN